MLFLLKKQKAENQGRMFRFKERLLVKAGARIVKMKSDVYQKNMQKGWRYVDQEEENFPVYVEDGKSDFKFVLKKKNSRTSVGFRHKTTKSDSVECTHTARHSRF